MKEAEPRTARRVKHTSHTCKSDKPHMNSPSIHHQRIIKSKQTHNKQRELRVKPIKHPSAHLDIAAFFLPGQNIREFFLLLYITSPLSFPLSAPNKEWGSRERGTHTSYSNSPSHGKSFQIEGQQRQQLSSKFFSHHQQRHKSVCV